jgi:SAM-dependent methyltransferase
VWPPLEEETAIAFQSEGIVIDETGRSGSFELIESALKARVKPGGTVLDVGCGAGPFMLALRAKGWLPVGIDVNPRSIEIAQSRGLDARVGTLEDVKPNGSFDAAVLMNALEYFPRPLEALERVAELLTDQGIVVIETPNALYHRKQAALGRVFHVGAKRLMTVEPMRGRRLVAFGPSSISSALERAGFEKPIVMAAVPRSSGNLVERAIRRSIFAMAGGLAGVTRERLALWPSLVVIATRRPA